MSSQHGAAVTLQSLTKRYGGHEVVRSISLTVQPGEFVTLLGPSGSGKTTTLNMIAGFVEVDAGEIFIDGRPIARVPAYRRNIGMVFQHYALFPHMTVEQNIAFPLRQRKVPKQERARRIGEALELVALGAFARRYPRQLSGGQQQRVALARALVFQPRVLLMDEPLGALDKKLREGLQQEIKRIHREVGITFIYVTHDQDEALLLSDRIAVFNQGRIEQVGTGSELYQEPASVFVADFLGDSNHFRGRLEWDGDRFYCVTDGYRLMVSMRQSLRAGEPAVVVVRPERTRVYTSVNGPSQTENQMRGRVEDVVFLGSALRIVVRLANGGLCVARQPQPTSISVNIGDDVALAWDPEDAILLSDHVQGERALDR
jgi:putative spermidine/putrescine transport system ATP-binding protein